MDKRKVIVVGCGLSGLSAACELSRVESFDICLIERISVLADVSIPVVLMHI